MWRQIKDALRTTRGADSLVTSLPLPEPVYRHLDESLEFSGPNLRANRTPFLINNKGDWGRRPRCSPWLPGRDRLPDVPDLSGTDVWQASHGGYRVHHNRVVFCGHYMRTFTRMSTMESANESARHAVNAILDHLAWSRGGDGASKATISGDHCEVWDIEQNELDELAFFKRVDQMLFKAGKPHMADILQFDRIADMQHPALTDAQALANALGVTAGKDWGVQPGEIAASLNGLLEVARSMAKDLGVTASKQSTLSALLSLFGASPQLPTPKR
ncbi:MAG: hypothetical protein U0326_43940 [Polyangiales bacterium]